ncbi:S41 family peptidase [Candidatus Foliamicus sp.]
MRPIGCLRSCSFRSGILAAAAASLLAACGGSGSDGPPPAPPSINVSDSSLDVGAAGETVSVNVSNGGGGTLNWSASIPDSVDWARIASGTTGTDAGNIEIEVRANAGAAREFALTVSAADAGSTTVTVRQAEAPPVLEVSAARSELDGEGGSVALQVRNAGYGAMQWSASLPDDADWAYIESGEEGTDSGEVVVRYNLNGGDDRELEVTVTAPGAENSPLALSLSQSWFASAACSYAEGRAEVLDTMETWYYFNDEPEQQERYDNLIISVYDNLDRLLDNLRWKPDTHDRNFTFWLTSRRTDMLLAGQAYVFGFRMRVVVDLSQNPLYLEIADVYANAPAGLAGLERGDRIVEVNGKAVDSLTLAQVDAELGPPEEGFEVRLEVEKQSGERRTITMAKDLVDVPTVPEQSVSVFDSAAGSVGYLHFRTFFGDASFRLLQEFAEFRRAGVRNLVVDLRYNGGGAVPIAEGLATLIGGPELFKGQQNVLSRRVHNERISARGFDQTAYFGCAAYSTPELRARCENESALPNLENVVFITGPSSASASELLITALQPYENVSLVGDRTFGKPVGQYGFGFCRAEDNSADSFLGYLWPVSFATVNAEGYEDYYDGIPVTEGCQVEDDLSRPLGDPEEARLAAALRYIETGSCGASASTRMSPPPGAVIHVPTLQDPVRQFLGH